MKTRRSEFVCVPESGGEVFAESEAHQWPNLTYGVFTGEFCAKSLIEVVRVSRSRLPRGSGNTIGVVTPEICVTGDETTFRVIAEEPCPLIKNRPTFCVGADISPSYTFDPTGRWE